MSDADLSVSATREREVRALLAAASEFPEAAPMLLTLDSMPPPTLPDPIRWRAAADWLLG